MIHHVGYRRLSPHDREANDFDTDYCACNLQTVIDP